MFEISSGCPFNKILANSARLPSAGTKLRGSDHGVHGPNLTPHDL